MDNESPEVIVCPKGGTDPVRCPKCHKENTLYGTNVYLTPAICCANCGLIHMPGGSFESLEQQLGFEIKKPADYVGIYIKERGGVYNGLEAA